MKKIILTRVGTILSSALIFTISLIILQFSSLNRIHGRSDAPIIVAIFGVIALLISYIFHLNTLTIIATFGYIPTLILGVIYNTDGVDVGGSATNNLWQIWLISYWIFLGIGLVVDIIMKHRKRK